METPESVSKEEFVAWKENKVTQAVLQYVEALQKDRMVYLANGSTIVKDADRTTDFIVGYIQGLNEILRVDHEETAKEETPEYDH
mgnify:CR=1 FL=1